MTNTGHGLLYLLVIQLHLKGGTGILETSVAVKQRSGSWISRNDIIFRQAKIILHLDNLADAGLLDLQLAKQGDYHRKIESYLDKKRVLYERLVLREVSMEEYKSSKAEIEKELQRREV